MTINELRRLLVDRNASLDLAQMHLDVERDRLRMEWLKTFGPGVTDEVELMSDTTDKLAALETADRTAAMQAAADPLGTYMGLKAEIAGLEAQAAECREAIEGILQGPPGDVWEFPGLATVAIVKGRVSEKLDRAKLAKAGVSAEVLDAATVRTEGAPSMRITAAKEDE